jgi:hypothetical protein
MQRHATAFSATLALVLIMSFSGCKSTTSAPDTSAQNPAPPAGAASDSAANSSGSPSANSPGRPSASGSARSAAPAPPARTQEPPQPVQVTLTVEPGRDIHARINETISSKTSNVGDGFTGELTSALSTNDGEVVFPKGTAVSGQVVASKGQGRFKGEGVLAIELKEIGGHPVVATEYVVSQKGKGKRSAALIGGGAGAGALIGGLAGGGKGALIGGLIGGGAGTAGAAYTGNKALIISSESIVVFELSKPVSVTVER